MINRKNEEIDRLNARCVELAEMLKEKNDIVKNISSIIENGDNNKEPYFNIVKQIKNTLAVPENKANVQI